MQSLSVGRWSVARVVVATLPAEPKQRGTREGWPHPPCRCSGQSQPHSDHRPDARTDIQAPTQAFPRLPDGKDNTA